MLFVWQTVTSIVLAAALFQRKPDLWPLASRLYAVNHTDYLWMRAACCQAPCIHPPPVYSMRVAQHAICVWTEFARIYSPTELQAPELELFGKILNRYIITSSTHTASKECVLA